MFNDLILWLSRVLYPKGRAFKMPYLTQDSPPSGGIFYRMHRALAQSENRALQDAYSILDSTLPDNDNFDANDCTNWERMLGIYSAAGTSLADRRAAIKAKLNYPGPVEARQTAAYIQSQLQLAGFNVKVFDNRFLEGSPPAYVTKSPAELLGAGIGEAVLSNFNLGEVNLGATWSDSGVSIVANYIEENKDESFGFGSNLRSTFYICADLYVGGVLLPQFADVYAVRKDEFRQMILDLKPLHSAAILFINYV